MKDNTRRAETLLSAMDGIDERFLAEAIAAQQAPHKRPHSARKWATIAASLLLAVSLAVAGVLTLRHTNKSDNQVPQAPDGVADFSALLLSCTQSTAFQAQTADGGRIEPDGSVRVVIGETGSDTVWVSRPLRAREWAVVQQEMTTAGSPATETPDAGHYRIWLIDRNGAVWSPSLCYSNGNITFGTVYDYNPERMPGMAFQTLLAGLAGRETKGATQ